MRGGAAASLVACAALLAGIAGCDRARSSRDTEPLAVPGAEPGTEGGGSACPAPELEDVDVVRFERDGSCLPGDEVVLYRCSPTAQPVLRLGAPGRPVAFLGGAFAVPTATLPANVRFAGGADGTEVLIADPPAPTPTPSASSSVEPSPEEPAPELEPLVYVRRGGVTERWLRLERRSAVHDPPALWLIGDSILHGGRDEVAAALEGWPLTLDAEVGRSSSAGVPLAQAAAEEEADVVLVQLGTNDSSVSSFRDHLIETLELLRGVPLVLWQTARGPEGDLTIGPVNAAIRETLPGYPNAAIADWEAFVPPEAVQIDGVHPDPGSEGLEAELLVPLVTEWRDAMRGEGAVSCGPRVVRSTR